MRKLLTAAFLLTVASSWADSEQALILHMNSGDRIVYELRTQPSIGFRENNMVVTTGNDSDEIPMMNVGRWEIGSISDSSVSETDSAETMEIRISGRDVTISNPGMDSIGIFSLSGTAVAQSGETEARFTLGSGIYIIRTSNKSFKIAVK